MDDLKKRAENGDAQAQNQLGASYELAEPPNLKEAAKWYRKAADQGDSGAQNNLGNHYLHGGGVPKDHAEAVRLFSKAAEKGNPAAQANLGNCYANGHGIGQNWAEAYFWWSISSRDDERIDLISEAAKHLTEDQRAAVDRHISNWQKTKK